ncbi:IclR family transcriptional regulator [Mycobacterium sp. 3519A]|uniref:IclR family transcriptional regulator n=1 Tax=Mycobacterium sp. 3519A TaxID=2057184 RepID=UPI000C7B3A17|nr:IclR family transcriptional regulator [Mycobacterium sp. 3519A]
MPGSIQSIERAAAIMDLIEQSDRPLQLRDIVQDMQLSKATVHGIVRTLVEVDYLQQDPDTGSYSPGPRAYSREGVELDGNDLRSISMVWADALALSSGFEVLMTLLNGHEADVVHHVFRPDDTAQTLRVGERIPLHATACGKLVLAYSPRRERILRNLRLERFTLRTSVNRARLTDEIERVRRSGVASASGEYDPDLAGVAVPVHGRSRSSVAAMAVLGSPESLLGRDGSPDTDVLSELRHAAAAVIHALQPTR